MSENNWFIAMKNFESQVFYIVPTNNGELKLPFFGFEVDILKLILKYKFNLKGTETLCEEDFTCKAYGFIFRGMVNFERENREKLDKEEIHIDKNILTDYLFKRYNKESAKFGVGGILECLGRNNGVCSKGLEGLIIDGIKKDSKALIDKAETVK